MIKLLQPTSLEKRINNTQFYFEEGVRMGMGRMLLKDEINMPI